MDPVKNLLLEWEVDESVIAKFLDHGIELSQLEELTDDHLKELVPRITDRLKLKNKIKERQLIVHIDIKVKEIILDSVDGLQVKEDYESQGFLTREQQTVIINVILDWTFQRNLDITPDLKTYIAAEICKVFPTEETGFYYIPNQPGRKAKGLFYQMYNNRKAASSKTKHLKGKEPNITDEEALFNCLAKDNVQQSVIYLRDEIEDNDNFDLIIEHWEKTFEARKIDLKICKKLEEYLEHWPILKKSYSYKLICLDFSKSLGETCAQRLLNNWNFFFENNSDVFIRSIADALTRTRLENLGNIESITAKQITYLLALHNLLPPSATKTKDRRWKPTILDSKNSFFKIVARLSDMDREMRVRENMCSLKGINNHPVIFGIGNQALLEQISEFYVMILNISFRFQSLLEAIDTAFKMFQMLSLQYPPESSKVWSFLNEVFYEIESQRSPDMKSIARGFKKINN